MPGKISKSGVNEFPRRGVCQICGCTDADSCVLEVATRRPYKIVIEKFPCYWADETETLCTNPVCLNTYWRGIEVVPAA